MMWFYDYICSHFPEEEFECGLLALPIFPCLFFPLHFTVMINISALNLCFLAH